MIRKTLTIALLIALSALLSAQMLNAQDEDELPVLRIGVLPVLNTLPLYVAQAEGFYEQAGVAVELINFNSAREQQIAITAGEIDGLNTDMAVQALIAGSGRDLIAVRHEPIRGAYFSIVAGADSGIESIEDLIGAEIAIAENTIIEYLTTAMLDSAGLSADDVVYEEVPEIPRRLQLLGTGELQAATLPEPLTTLATALQGGAVIASDSDLSFVPTVLAFTGDIIAEQPDAIAAFLSAYENAVNAINADGEAFREVMNSNLIIPEPLQPTYPVPAFPTAQVPTPEQVALVVDWMVERGLLAEALAYDALVSGDFLPLPTIAEIAVSEGNFETLVNAATSVGLVDALASTAVQSTVFAPTDAAFAGVDLDALVDSDDALAEILLYHIVAGQVSAADIIAAESGALTTLSGAEIAFEVVDGVVVLNGAVTVTLADIDASNGIIHVIDGVLLPAETDE